MCSHFSLVQALSPHLLLPAVRRICDTTRYVTTCCLCTKKAIERLCQRSGICYYFKANLRDSQHLIYSTTDLSFTFMCDYYSCFVKYHRKWLIF